MNVWGVDYSDVLDDSDKVRSSTGIFTTGLSPIGPLSFTLSTHLSKNQPIKHKVASNLT